MQECAPLVQLPICKLAYSTPPSNMDDHLRTSRLCITWQSPIYVSSEGIMLAFQWTNPLFHSFDKEWPWMEALPAYGI